MRLCTLAIPQCRGLCSVHLVVGSVHHDHGEEALGQGLVEELEQAGTVVGLHCIIIFILLNLWERICSMAVQIIAMCYPFFK